MIDSQRAELIGAIDRDGCTVVEGLLGADQVAAAAVALDEVFAAEADIAPARGWLTDTYRVAYALPVKHPVLLDVCTSPVVAITSSSVMRLRMSSAILWSMSRMSRTRWCKPITSTEAAWSLPHMARSRVM